MVIESNVKVKGNDKISNVNHSEWSKFRIKDICELINGRGFKPHEWEKKGLPIIRIQNLNGSKEFNYYTGKYNEKILVKNNELLFAWSGSRGTSFGPYIWKFNDGLLNYHTWRIKVNESLVTKEFLFHSLKILTKHIEDSAHGASALVHVQKSQMECFEIMIPDIDEQKAIATALSDMDDLILSLEKLISKKKMIKEGTMEELLTGKKRLDGFNKKWNNIVLGKILKFQTGFPFKSEYFNQNGNGIRLIKNRDLKNDDQVYYYSGEYSKEYIVNNGDILVSMDGDFIPCLWRKNKSLLNQRVGRIIKLENININYIRYSLIKPLIELQRGTCATTVKHLSHGDIESMQLYMSVDVSEQNAIANILLDMDNEIEKLEMKLDKYKNIKNGMMEELLTGKRRLV